MAQVHPIPIIRQLLTQSLPPHPSSALLAPGSALPQDPSLLGSSRLLTLFGRGNAILHRLECRGGVRRRLPHERQHLARGDHPATLSVKKIGHFLLTVRSFLLTVDFVLLTINWLGLFYLWLKLGLVFLAYGGKLVWSLLLTVEQ